MFYFITPYLSIRYYLEVVTDKRSEELPTDHARPYSLSKREFLFTESKIVEERVNTKNSFTLFLVIFQ